MVIEEDEIARTYIVETVAATKKGVRRIYLFTLPLAFGVCWLMLRDQWGSFGGCVAAVVGPFLLPFWLVWWTRWELDKSSKLNGKWKILKHRIERDNAPNIKLRTKTLVSTRNEANLDGYYVLGVEGGYMTLKEANYPKDEVVAEIERSKPK